MAIAFKADGGWAAEFAQNITMTVPSVNAGDLMIAVMKFYSQNAGMSIVTNSSWTPITTPAANFAIGYYQVIGAYYRIATGSEPATYAFTRVNGGGGGVGNIRAFSGTDSSLPINSYAFDWDPTGATITIPPLNETFASGEWGVYCNFNGGGGIAITSNSPAVFSNVSTGTNDQAYWLGNYIPPSSPGAQTFNWPSGAVLQGIGFTIIPPGFAVKLRSQSCL